MVYALRGIWVYLTLESFASNIFTSTKSTKCYPAETLSQTHCIQENSKPRYLFYHHQRLKAVMQMWNCFLTVLPALTLHGGRRRACNIHRACTKQHTLLLMKEPMKVRQIQKSFDPTFEAAKGHQSSMSPMSHFDTLCHYLYTWYSEMSPNVKG